MRKQTIRAAAAFSLICSIGFTNAINAEASPNNHPLSDNCKQAWSTADSLVITVPKIICREEDGYDEAISNFLSQTNNLSGKEFAAPVHKKLPKFPSHSNSERPRGTKPKRPAKEKRAKVHTWGGNHFIAHHRAHGKKIATGKGKAARRKNHRATTVASAAVIRNAIYRGIDLSELSPAQRKDLRRKLELLLKRIEVIATLNAIQKAEDGDLLRVVGGLRGKSADCQRRIRNLNLSGHPKEQGLPNRCFLTTRKHGLSTAAGLYQIVYYRNWKALRKLFGFENFSRKNQAVAALELMRISKVRGGKVGEGLVALMQGDWDNAIRKGTDPWASSPYSRWHGKRSAPLLKYARQELRKLGNETYTRQEFEKFTRDSKS